MKKFYLIYPVATCANEKNELRHAGSTMIHDIHYIVMYVASQQIQDFLEAFFMFFQYKMRYLVVRQVKESIICFRMEQKNLSLPITVCHHLASLQLPIGDPGDGFFYPTLTRVMDSYSIPGYPKFSPQIVLYLQKTQN